LNIVDAVAIQLRPQVVYTDQQYIEMLRSKYRNATHEKADQRKNEIF